MVDCQDCLYLESNLEYNGEGDYHNVYWCTSPNAPSLGWLTLNKNGDCKDFIKRI